MRLQKTLSIAILSLLFSYSFAQNHKSGQYVVMLSMDAFRYDYPEIYKTTELKKIAESGVRAKSFISSFPTVTFPNHYAMATGLYPDHHGIVLNNFFCSGTWTKLQSWRQKIG